MNSKAIFLSLYVFITSNVLFAQDTINSPYFDFIETSSKVGFSKYYFFLETQSTSGEWTNSADLNISLGKQLNSTFQLKFGLEGQKIWSESTFDGLVFNSDISQNGKIEKRLVGIKEEAYFISIPISLMVRPIMNFPLEFDFGLTVNKFFHGKITEEYDDSSYNTQVYTNSNSLEIGHNASLRYRLKFNNQFDGIFGISEYISVIRFQNNQDELVSTFFEGYRNLMANIGIRYSF